jgi:hypothetical protein
MGVSFFWILWRCALPWWILVHDTDVLLVLHVTDIEYGAGSMTLQREKKAPDPSGDFDGEKRLARIQASCLKNAR